MLNAKNLLFLILITFFNIHTKKVHAQKKICAHKAYNKSSENLKVLESIDFENWIQSKIALDKIAKRHFRVIDGEIKIPVVFHVIHNGEPYGQGRNIPDEQIFSQLRVLNEDFNRENKDKVDTPLEFQDRAANAGIRFVLARQNPNGNPTTAIRRVKSSRTFWQTSENDRIQLSELSYWPSEDYLNIWICQLAGLVIGISSFPETNLAGLLGQGTTNPKIDGILMNYKNIGSIDDGPFPTQSGLGPANKGRTLSHEIGHFLGLIHTWGDSYSSCTAGDYCDDTPATTSPNQNNCQRLSSTCPNETEQVMIQNYMDYSPDECMNLFTKDQKSRMLTVMNNSPRRVSLQYSKALEYSDVPNTDILALSKINQPAYVSSLEKQNLIFTIQNNSDSTLNSFDLNYTINDSSTSKTFSNLNLKTKESIQIEIPETSFKTGKNELNLQVSKPNGKTDGFLENNQINTQIIIKESLASLPYKEEFNSLITDQWTDYSQAHRMKWEIINSGVTPNASLDYSKGFKDETASLVSPSFDFTDLEEISARIIYEYTSDKNETNELKIFVSTASPEAYDTEVVSSTLNPSDTEQQILLDLNPLAKEKDIRFSFTGKKQGDGILKIKRIDIYNHDISLVNPKENGKIILYPNPVKNHKLKLHFDFNKTQIQVITILYNTSGSIVQTNNLKNILNQTIELNLNPNARGIHILRIVAEESQETRKIIIR